MIMAAPASQRRKLLLKSVREQAIRVLGMTTAYTFDLRQPLNELGLDSLMAVELCNMLSITLGQALPTTLLFNYPTLEALVDYLATEVLSLEDMAQLLTKAREDGPVPGELTETGVEFAADDIDALLNEELNAIDELMEGM
jgi:acyl carrier protein